MKEIRPDELNEWELYQALNNSFAPIVVEKKKNQVQYGNILSLDIARFQLKLQKHQ